jgi:hypothetical protein
VNYTFKDITFTQEEFTELKTAMGEFRRICRDQVYRYVKGDYVKSNSEVNTNRLEIAESIVNKINTAEYLNHNIK